MIQQQEQQVRLKNENTRLLFLSNGVYAPNLIFVSLLIIHRYGQLDYSEVVPFESLAAIVPDAVSPSTILHGAPVIAAGRVHSPLTVKSHGARANYLSSNSSRVKRDSQGPKPKRRGPLNPEVRHKVEEMRDMSACWRCRKYKKSVSRSWPYPFGGYIN